MDPRIKNVLAVIAGCVVGMIVNGGLIAISSSIIPPPEGADVTTMEGLKASMHLMTPKHFLMPFLAHAGGTLVGGLLAAYIAATHKMKAALVVGVFFLLGGIANIVMLPSPAWFTALDLGLAYLPMGWLAGRTITKSNSW